MNRIAPGSEFISAHVFFEHGVAIWFLDAAGAKDRMQVEPCILSAKSDFGEQHIHAMTLAGEYAYGDEISLRSNRPFIGSLGCRKCAQS
jgi:hypothetical protein